MASAKFDVTYTAYKIYVMKDLELSGRRALRHDNPTVARQLLTVADRQWWDDMAAEPTH